jgi:arsenate reductase-like glutaredoxin family protein
MNSQIEIYEVEIRPTGTRHDWVSQIRNAANLLRDKARSRNPAIKIVPRAKEDKIIIYGMARPDLENLLAAIQNTSETTHSSPFEYSIESRPPTEEELLKFYEVYIAEQDSIIRKQDSQIANLQNGKEQSDKKSAKLAAEIAGLEGMLKTARRELDERASTPIVKIEKVVEKGYKLPEQDIVDIIKAAFQFPALKEGAYDLAFDGVNSISEAMELAKHDKYAFFSKRLEHKVKNDIEVVLWLDKQDHSSCDTSRSSRWKWKQDIINAKPPCIHVKKILDLENQYEALCTVVSECEINTRIRPDILYIISEENGKCLVYLPTGKGDGWFTKQIRDHVLQTLEPHYQNIVSDKSTGVRKLTVPSGKAEEIKELLEKSQNKYEFTKMNYSIKIVIANKN